MNNGEIRKMLKEHEIWVKSKGVRGKRADLRWADLSRADLRWADLSRANLRWADLSEADLREAKARRAAHTGSCFLPEYQEESDD